MWDIEFAAFFREYIGAALAPAEIVSVEISKYVTKLGSAPFHSCLNLTEITVDVENEKYQSIDGNLYSKDGKMFIQYVA